MISKDLGKATLLYLFKKLNKKKIISEKRILNNDTRIYKLKNGLKVYLCKDNLNPKVETRTVIKAGSAQDPKDAMDQLIIRTYVVKGTKN